MSDDKQRTLAAQKVHAFKKSGFKKIFNGVKSILKEAQTNNLSEQETEQSFSKTDIKSSQRGDKEQPKQSKNSLNDTKLVAITRKYFPDFWNSVAGGILYNNNCYSYACNDPFDHTGKPQPGEKSGKMCSKMTVEDVAKASLNDGLLKADLDEQGNPIPKEGYYLVALVVAKDFDYHWYRQDENGKWTHKMGSTQVYEQDQDGKKIDDPRNCNRGCYEDFGGFFYVPNEGLRIGKKARVYANDNLNDDYRRHSEKLTQGKRRLLGGIVEKVGVFEKPFANQNNQSVTKIASRKRER